MSEAESKPNSEAIVYFVISPLEGPAYRICGDDELQALGGVHAFERHLENQSYWFARMGQISLNLNPYGATFQDSDLAKLPEPAEDAWQTGRLNPSFGRSEIKKRTFKEVFRAIQRLLHLWTTGDGVAVEAYALRELKNSAARLVSLTTGLCALKHVHDLVEVTVVKFWYDSLWLSKPVLSTNLSSPSILSEFLYSSNGLQTSV
jgi:hypothetical protein